MTEQNIYLKTLIEDVKNNKSDSLVKIIKLFETYMRMLSKHKGTYIYDELLEELLSLILTIDLNKENLFGYLKVCLKNYSIKLIKEQNKQIQIDGIQNTIFYEKDTIDSFNIDERIEKYLNNKDLFNKLLPNNLSEDDKLLVIEYFINHKTINELMELTSKKQSTIYMKLRSCRHIIEDYILKEVII